MRVIESDAVFMEQGPGSPGLYEHIEKCGRTCYKSEGNIKENSAMGFVTAMINSNHGAMLEHGTVYLKDEQWCGSFLEKYKGNKYSRYKKVHLDSEIIEDGNDCYTDHKYGYYVTTNLRVLVENGWLDDLKYLCEPTEHHERRYTIRFICDRGVTHELVRHRKFSFAQESSRYCNYGNENKFGKELTFICPSWIRYDEFMERYKAFDSMKLIKNTVLDMIAEDRINDNLTESEIDDAMKERCTIMLINEMMTSEKIYMYLIGHGYKPQQARFVLPTGIKSEICMTGFASDWRFFFDLRLFGKTGAPHPDMLRVAEIAKKRFEEHGYWDDIMSYKSKFSE